MITSEISKSRVLRKITLGVSAAVMAVGLVATFSAETMASGSGTALENGRPLLKDQNNNYCCENSGDDCGAACC